MRKVMILEFGFSAKTRNPEKHPTGTLGYFHQWGTDYEVVEGEGIAQIPVAIVELEDGTVENFFSELIRFIN